MAVNFYQPQKNVTDAYCTDGTHTYFGKAARGCKLTDAGWQIIKMEMTGSNWVMKYPIDPATSLGSDAPKFVWGVNGATAITLTYALLGCTT